jgi:hypothetical protein
MMDGTGAGFGGAGPMASLAMGGMNPFALNPLMLGQRM